MPSRSGDIERPTARDERRTRLARVGLVLGGLVVAVFLLSPSAALPSSTVGWVADLAHAVGVPESVATGRRVEFALNALAIAPLAFLGLWAFPETTWRDWTAYGFVASLSVETVQFAFLVGRSAQVEDVVANTAGAFVGAVLGWSSRQG
ncbi:MAG: VanZ family protein [Nocardioides sp.]|nr:VanZ family protein [Nocardioides sp.]